MKAPQFYLILFFLIAHVTAVVAQTYIMGLDTFVTTCSGEFYDDGGPGNDYLPNGLHQLTFCPEENNSNIRISLPALFIEEGDLLCFYDGMNTTAPLLICSDQVLYGLGFTVQGSMANPSGCITAVFESDANGNGFGWEGSISCIEDCQPILPAIGLSEPALSNLGTLDLCPGDTMTLNGTATYPQNGLGYTQSDELTHFKWIFGDGNFAEGDTVHHVYESSGGYLLQLIATDTAGCTNTFSLHQRVQVSEYPAFFTSEDTTTYCPGDTISLLGGTENNPVEQAIVSAYNPGMTFLYSDGQNQQLFLPDGNGTSYTGTVNVNSFPPGSTIINGNELQGICLDLEHSYAGDLDIEIICPNGQSAYMINYGTSSIGSTNFGEPWATGSVDVEQMDSTQGIPYTYCFSMINNDFGTLNSEAGNFIYTYTTVPNAEGEQYTYEDHYFPAGTYLPATPLTALEGCPLNGAWTIRVQDNLYQDNGWLFLWNINFFLNTLPAFSADISSTQWLPSSSTLYVDSTALIAIADTVNQMTFRFEATNAFGCRSEETITIPIQQADEAPCGVATRVKEPRSNDQQFLLYPNPAQTEVQISFPEALKSNGLLRLTNAQGSLIRHIGLPEGTTEYTLDLQGLAPGYYVLSSQAYSGRFAARPLVIAK